MNEQQASQRIAKLRAVIDDYRYHYHVLNESVMSEEAADSLKHELAQLEAQFPSLITADSPSQRIAGSVLPGFKSVRHLRRMISLQDVFNTAEVVAWRARIAKMQPAVDLKLFADIKMDGLACALIYQDGSLTTGITRGDGFVGEDVTANIRTIDSIPLTLRRTKDCEPLLNGRTEVRGEIVMYRQDFERLNEQRRKSNLPLFANPRNTAAGTIRQLDPSLVAARPLHFRAYELFAPDGVSIETYLQTYKLLNDLGFATNSQAAVYSTVEEVMQFASDWEGKRDSVPFNTDGLVIKVNDRQVYDSLGVVGKAPRGAVAFKYAAEEATTKVKDIFVSIGRTGTATPVAMLEPVVVAGSTVQMATLHNESEVRRKDIRVGDSVIIHKAGDIIPEVVRPILELREGHEKPFTMPEFCPICQTKLIKQQAKDAAWRCPNVACPSRAWKEIEHFASKEALDIEGLGEKNVIALMDAKLVISIADIYRLKVEQLLKLDRFAQISATKLVKSIQDKKQPPLARFIYGLGIRHVGSQTAIDLARHFHSLDALTAASSEQLAAIEGIGPVVATAVAEYFIEPKHQRLLEDFRSLGVWPVPLEEASGPLTGKKIVVTGSLENLSRDQAAERIRQAGGTFQSSVAKDTDYIVVGDSPGKSKLTKAEKQQTPVINEQQLLQLLDSGKI